MAPRRRRPDHSSTKSRRFAPRNAKVPIGVGQPFGRLVDMGTFEEDLTESGSEA